MSERERTRRAIARTAHALRPYLDSDRGPTRAALEVARNAAAVLLLDDGVSAEQMLRDMLAHRLRHGWIRCGSLESAARVGGAAWHRVYPLSISREAVAA